MIIIHYTTKHVYTRLTANIKLCWKYYHDYLNSKLGKKSLRMYRYYRIVCYHYPLFSAMTKFDLTKLN